MLAVDIPSGIDGDTAGGPGSPCRATATVTFAALKPGLLQADGPVFAGRSPWSTSAFPSSGARLGAMTDGDIAELLPARAHGPQVELGRPRGGRLARR